MKAQKDVGLIKPGQRKSQLDLTQKTCWDNMSILWHESENT